MTSPEPLSVHKFGHAVPVSPEAVTTAASPDFAQLLAARLDRMLNATPEQRAQWRAESARREAQQRRERAELRAGTAAVPLTVDALADKMGWSREYADHLVQPYCECGDDRDGWHYCEHARDLGLAP